MRVTAANVPLIYLQAKPSAAHIHLPVKSTVLNVPLIHLKMEPPAAHNHISVKWRLRPNFPLKVLFTESWLNHRTKSERLEHRLTMAQTQMPLEYLVAQSRSCYYNSS